jgi:hypothetical protein
MDDPDNRILEHLGFMESELDYLVRSFPVPTIAIELTSLTSLLSTVNNLASCEDLWLAVVPVRVVESLSFVILDLKAKEWAHINPDPVGWRESSAFNPIALTLKRADCRFKGFSGRPLTITCYFHQEYRIMHLLMAIFCFGQALGYAKTLPLRVVYTEKRLRGFCYHVCKELQYRNADFNFKHNFVKDNGFLLPGAYRSLPSPVPLRRFPVRTDLCLFCSSSQKRNLGSHMAMRHGDQALAKRERRRELEERR